MDRFLKAYTLKRCLITKSTFQIEEDRDENDLSIDWEIKNYYNWKLTVWETLVILVNQTKIQRLALKTQHSQGRLLEWVKI